MQERRAGDQCDLCSEKISGRRLEGLKELVPETTYTYLLSHEGKALREKLRNREKTDET